MRPKQSSKGAAEHSLVSACLVPGGSCEVCGAGPQLTQGRLHPDGEQGLREEASAHSPGGLQSSTPWSRDEILVLFLPESPAPQALAAFHPSIHEETQSSLLKALKSSANKKLSSLCLTSTSQPYLKIGKCCYSKKKKLDVSPKAPVNTCKLWPLCQSEPPGKGDNERNFLARGTCLRIPQDDVCV